MGRHHRTGGRVHVPRELRHAGGGHRAVVGGVDWTALVVLGGVIGYVVAAAYALVRLV